jgi:hypothetical protein
MMTKKKKTLKTKNNSVFIEGEKTLDFESPEMEKIQIEQILNKIGKRTLDDIMDF